MFLFTKKHRESQIALFSLVILLTATSVIAAPSDRASYAGAWKGTTYTGFGTYPDVILTLNADGSYSCSGYPPKSTNGTDPWTPWRVICEPEAGQTSQWDVILPAIIQFTHNHSTLAPISLVSVSTLAGQKMTLELPGGANSSNSLIFADFTK